MTSAPLSNSLRDSLARACEEYEAQLTADPRAQEYLERRGLTGVTDRLRFGSVLSRRHDHPPWVEGRLAIPFLGPRGNVYDIRFRCMGDHDCRAENHSKYLPAYEGIPTKLYNVRATLAPTDYIFVTEGELDAATIEACGWPAVGCVGAENWKPHYGRLLHGFSQVVLLADGDSAGKDLAARFRRALPSSGRVIIVPTGTDVNQVYVQGGKEALAEIMREDQ